MIRVKVRKKLMGASGEFTLDTDFTVSPGSFTTLFGDSGAGKTTILRCIAGLEQPDEGFIGSESAPYFQSEKKINIPTQKRNVGVVFQDYALFPNMSVRENLLYASGKRKETSYVDELLDLTGLTALARRKPPTLSGGQKQRVALARALVRRPDVLLLDEPLSALDPAMRSALQNEILRIHKQLNLTTILVSHDYAEVFRMSDHVHVIENGVITRNGPPEQIFHQSNTGGRFRFVGDVVAVTPSDFYNLVSIMVGNDLIKVLATNNEIRGIQKGDRVVVLSKGFNPILERIE